MERDDVINVLKEDFGADCEFGVLLPDGKQLRLIGLIYGCNINEDVVFVAEGGNIEVLGTGAILLSDLEVQ